MVICMYGILCPNDFDPPPEDVSIDRYFKYLSLLLYFSHWPSTATASHSETATHHSRLFPFGERTNQRSFLPPSSDRVGSLLPASLRALSAASFQTWCAQRSLSATVARRSVRRRLARIGEGCADWCSSSSPTERSKAPPSLPTDRQPLPPLIFISLHCNNSMHSIGVVGLPLTSS